MDVPQSPHSYRLAMPIRFYRALPPRSSLSLPSLSIPSTSQLFHNPTTSADSALGAISSPYNLTRREMLSKHKALSRARDEAARLLGNLAANGPRWDEQSELDVSVETGRIFALVSEVLEAPLPRSNSPAATPRRSRSSMMSQSQPRPTPAPTPAQLLPLLETHLPTLNEKLRLTMRNHGRPSALTRLWFPLLFVPPTLWLASKTILKNRDWIKEQAANATDTVRGFVIQWVYEPVMGILGTVRGGGEGLGVAPTTVKSDQEVRLS
jgi:nuclear-control-of-ATPase protein 2